MDNKMKPIVQKLHQCMINSVVISCIPIIIAGCSFGPDYKQPDVKTPEGWAHNSNLSDAQVNLSDTSWWGKFNDPVLNNLIIQALENNNNIHHNKKN